MKVDVGTKNIYYDGYLLQSLDVAKKIIKNDWDMLFIIDGIEGGGKSTIAQQIAAYCDPTLCIERIAWTPEQFKEVILKAEHYQAIIFDEGYTGLSSRGTMSEVNKILIQLLAEIRQKNLFIFIIIPTFFDLDRYVALWRSRALIHVYADKWQRGFFKFYNAERKKDLYINGKKTYNYKAGAPNFIGRFSNGYYVDDEAYRIAKYNALKYREDRREAMYKVRFEQCVTALCDELGGREAEKRLQALGLDLTWRELYHIAQLYRKAYLVKSEKENI